MPENNYYMRSSAHYTVRFTNALDRAYAMGGYLTIASVEVWAATPQDAWNTVEFAAAERGLEIMQQGRIRPRHDSDETILLDEALDIVAAAAE